MIQLFLSSVYPAPRMFQCLEMHKKLVGSTVGTAEANRPKGCSTPWTSCPVHKLGVVGWDGLITAWGWDGHLSVGGEELLWASLVSLGFCLLLFFIIFNIYYS